MYIFTVMVSSAMQVVFFACSKSTRLPLLLLLQQQDTQDAAMKRCLTVMKEAFERCCRDAHVLDAAVGAHYGKRLLTIQQGTTSHCFIDSLCYRCSYT
jgi:hypothetical protein